MFSPWVFFLINGGRHRIRRFHSCAGDNQADADLPAMSIAAVELSAFLEDENCN
jgi:hypothetical protein